LQSLGAVVQDVVLPDIAERLRISYDANLFETETALDTYLSQHTTAPIRTLRALVEAPGALLPWRATALRNTLGRGADDAAYFKVLKNTEDLRRLVLTRMADQSLDVLAYPTADHFPALIAADIATNPDVVGDTRLGSNRTLASVLGFPAITVPAGFTADQMPVGLEFMGRAFDDAKILGYAFSYEQGTHHRRAPKTTPPLAR
jgi:Asp-tRNA(Asn)/Glu-tRNA(Gln) amidotransferase A subunit family amidase